MKMVTMSGQQSAALVVALVGFCAVSAGCEEQTPRETANIVRQVDHILIVSTEAKELFSLLSGTFQLPVAWPMTDYGGFASGGIAMGNVNLEIIKDPEPAAGVVKSRWTGFALEPEPLRSSLAEMDAQGIRHGPPAPFRSMQPDGSFTTRWTTVALPDVSSDDVEIFLCQFGDDLPARRRHSLEQLRSGDGGPLSAHSIKEIVYGASDVKRMQLQWQKLLNPRQESSPGVWQVGAGPALRLVQADHDGIQGLVVNVKSIEKARRFLKEHGLLGAERPGTLILAGSQLENLNVTLVEQYPEGS
jgi:Glyoxalase-like domain